MHLCKLKQYFEFIAFCSSLSWLINRRPTSHWRGEGLQVYFSPFAVCFPESEAKIDSITRALS